VILSGPCQVFNRLAEIAAVQLGAAFAGRSDEDYGKPGIECHRHQSGLAEARNAFDADFPGIDRLIRFEVIQPAGGTPRPSAQCAPVIRFSGGSFIDQADDALGQARTVVRLDAVWIDTGITPPIRQQLLRRRRSLPAGVGPKSNRLYSEGVGVPGRVQKPNIIMTGTGPLAFAGVTRIIRMPTSMDGYPELSRCPINCFPETEWGPTLASLV